MQQKELLTKVEVANFGEEISHEMGAEFIKSFQTANPTTAPYFTIGRNVIDSILAQPGCAGMRFYNAINEFGQNTLVYVAVDAAGNDITKHIVIDNTGKITEQNAIVADRIVWPFGPSTGPGVTTPAIAPY